jgi:hypothetical protein
MRNFLAVLILLPLVSCGTAATLVTDEVFRASAPEVVRAWGSLSPWKNARIENLPAGAGAAALRGRIATLSLPRKLLIGVALTAEERVALVQSFPTDRYVFLGPDKDRAGQATVAVDRSRAWALVAAEAARNKPGTAAVFYPADVTAQESEAFSKAWAAAGGSGLEVRTPNSPGPWNPLPSQVFQWEGPDADPAILTLPPSVLVHGDPGTVRTQGARGLTWKLREKDLGNFLWDAVQNAGKSTVFLPLETEWVSR